MQEEESKHKVEGDDEQSEEVEEYLLIAFWQYDEERDRIDMVREYEVTQPFSPTDCLRLVRLSEQAKVAFWFEKGGKDELVYREVSLENPGEPDKISIRFNQDLLE